MSAAGGEARRRAILDMLGSTTEPLSGSAIGRALGVSRQVVVGDVALLRSQGHAIASTNRGYVLGGAGTAGRVVRLVKVRHTTEQVADELDCIVDRGGWVLDVIVNHRAYGRISAPLGIKCRADVERYLDDIASGKSSPLMNVTSGYHFHHISAETSETLDGIEAALGERGYLAELLPYERGTI